MDVTAVKNVILALLAAVGSFLANALGGWDMALAVLIGFMAADYITGILVALVFHSSPKTEGGGLASGECYKGLFRKCMILLFVWLGSMLDDVVGGTYVRMEIIIFYIGNEGLSIIENTAYMGLPYPKFLKQALEGLRSKGNGGDVSNVDTSGEKAK